MSGDSDHIWSAETIKELLCNEQSKPLPHTLLPSHALLGDLDCKSDSTASELSLARKKVMHRKVPPKARFMRKEESEGVRVPSLGSDSGCEQMPMIAEASQPNSELERTYETGSSASPARKNVYERYSMQQKKAILNELKGRINTIESSILSAKSALQNIIRFL